MKEKTMFSRISGQTDLLIYSIQDVIVNTFCKVSVRPPSTINFRSDKLLIYQSLIYQNKNPFQKNETGYKI